MAVRARQPSRPLTPGPPPEQDTPGRVQVPDLVTDPVCSLQPWSTTVSYGPWEWEVPAMPAVQWLAILMDPDMELMDIFPGTLSQEDQEQVWELVLERGLGENDLLDLILEVLSTASGRPWWVTMRLIATARQHWASLGAEMLMRGMDATHLSLGGWLDVLLLTIMRNIDKKDAMMFTLQLEAPPRGEEQDQPAMAADAFLAMG